MREKASLIFILKKKGDFNQLYFFLTAFEFFCSQNQIQDDSLWFETTKTEGKREAIKSLVSDLQLEIATFKNVAFSTEPISSTSGKSLVCVTFNSRRTKGEGLVFLDSHKTGMLVSKHAISELTLFIFLGDR